MASCSFRRVDKLSHSSSRSVLRASGLPSRLFKLCLPSPAARPASHSPTTSTKRAFLARASHLWALARPFAAKAQALIAPIGQEAWGFAIVSFRKFKARADLDTKRQLLNTDLCCQYAQSQWKSPARKGCVPRRPAFPFQARALRCVCGDALRVRELRLPSLSSPTRAALALVQMVPI
jgi:hypothetical protein